MTMKRSDRTILLLLGVLALLAGFWFLVLAPKREKAAELGDRVAQVQQEIDAQRQLLSQVSAAKDGYESSYRSLVELGKAVPADAETSSMIVQMQELADRAKVDFDAITLTDGAPDAPKTAASETTTDQNEEAQEAPTMVAATEASAASLPLGATVGPAGLPVMSYEVGLAGDFFGIADFLASIDKLVHHRGGKLAVNGRLYTVNGFEMEPLDKDSASPRLEVSLSLSSFLVPGSPTGGAGAATATPTTNPAP